MADGGALSFSLDQRGIERIEAAMKAAGGRAHDAIRRALNWTGDYTKTRVVNALTKQTGLKRGVILRAVVATRANFGALIYRMRSRGGDIALKYFGARETRAGVTAAPWGVRHLYAGTFIKGGLFPNRVPLALNGQVFKRAGAGRLPIHKEKSGLYIPEEMVRSASAAAFEETVAAVLPKRVEHEVAAILSGAVR